LRYERLVQQHGEAGDVRVGFIGLGNQGAPIARRIADAFELHVWARRQASIDELGCAALVAATPRELAERTEVVCICVRDDDGVQQVVGGPDGVLAGLQPGSVLVLHSTIHPDTPRRLAEQVPAGVGVLDCPVSGGGQMAEQGQQITIVGGSAEVLARVEPILRTHSREVFHVGDLGAGQLAKLVNNTVFTANLTAASEGVRIGAALGLDAAVLQQVLQAGSGASSAGRSVASFGPIPFGGMGASLLAKDVGLLRRFVTSESVDFGLLHTTETALGLDDA
jgi:3-hydroxyisobutyrate dehydrogenase-like beta-hydroxyacid dehydrogenase